MSYLAVMGPAVDDVCACVCSSSLEAVCALVGIVLGAGTQRQSNFTSSIKLVKKNLS